MYALLATPPWLHEAKSPTRSISRHIQTNIHSAMALFLQSYMER
jgi:hypothetical protein